MIVWPGYQRNIWLIKIPLTWCQVLLVVYGKHAYTITLRSHVEGGEERGFCGLGTRLALEIRDQFPAVPQTDFEQTANFRGSLLQKGLITLLFSRLLSCFCRNWTFEGCLPQCAALVLFWALTPRPRGMDGCIAFTSDYCRSRTKFISHSRCINWHLIELMQHKWIKRCCGCYCPFPFQGGRTEFLDNEGLSFVLPIS